MTGSVSQDMLFRWLFIASNLKIYLETLTGIVLYITLGTELRNQESLIQNPLQDELFIQLLDMPMVIVNILIYFVFLF